MPKIITIALLLIPLIGSSDQRLIEITAYINAVWYAEEYNELCPRHSISVPISEAELREIMVSLDGEDTIEKMARDPNRPEVNFRDAVKELAQDSITRGCDSQLAMTMRARTEESLVVPDFVNQYKNPSDEI